MRHPEIVIDTNVLVAALRSKRGLSHRLLRLVGTGAFDLHISVPLVLEYEYAVKKHLAAMMLEEKDVGDVLDYLCAVSEHEEISFLWRPHLRDPKDEMVLEVAFVGGCDSIVTFNTQDFAGAHELGIAILTPGEFLERIGKL